MDTDFCRSHLQELEYNRLHQPEFLVCKRSELTFFALLSHMLVIDDTVFLEDVARMLPAFKRHLLDLKAARSHVIYRRRALNFTQSTDIGHWSTLAICIAQPNPSILVSEKQQLFVIHVGEELLVIDYLREKLTVLRLRRPERHSLVILPI